MSILNVNQLQPVGGGNTITVSASDVNFSGNISIGSSFVGTASTATLATISQGLTGTPDITVNNIQSGVVTATTFIGDGSGITGVTASGSGINIKDSNSTVGVAATVDFGTNLNVSPASAGIVTVTVGDTDFEIADKIIHTGDTNTAIRFPADDTVSVETAGTERLRITSSGDLSISGNVSVGGTLTCDDVTNIDSVGVITARNGIHIPGGGNLVGIGTTNPLSRLHVSGTHNSHIRMTNTSDDAVDLIGDSNRTSVNSSILAIKGRWNGTDVAKIVFQAATDTTDKDDGNILFHTKDSGSSIAERLRITSGGNVGIGTDNPDSLLHVYGSNSTQKLITLSSGISKRNNYIGINGADNLEIGADEDAEGNDSSIRLRVDGTERLRITSAGSVGIGTNDPGNHKLHLYGATNSDLRLTATGDDIVNILANSNRSSANDSLFAIKAEWNGTQVGNIKINAGDDTTNKDDGYITFTTRESGAASAERLRITSDGKVGINETSPGATLHVADIGSTIPCLLLSGGTATEGDLAIPSNEDFNIGHWNASAGSFNERIRLDSGGVMYMQNSSAATQVKFGTIDGSSFENREHAIYVHGHSTSDYTLLRGCNTADGTPVFDAYVSGSRSIEIESNGDVHNATGTFSQISDSRFKENIVDSPSQWEDVKALRVRKFNFTEASGYQTHTQIGYVAQEVEQVSPGLVKTRYEYDEDGDEISGSDYKTVKASLINVKAVKALQEAMARIEVLESRLNAAGIAT